MVWNDIETTGRDALTDLQDQRLRKRVSYVYENVPFYHERFDDAGVSPSDIEVIDDMDDDRLTLTSCHPKYSARQRIIISALLVDDPAPPTPRPTRDVAQAVESIDGEDETGPLAPVILFGLLTLAVWILFYVLSRKWRRWPSYALGVVPFGVSLFVWFGAVAELLPSNF